MQAQSLHTRARSGAAAEIVDVLEDESVGIPGIVECSLPRSSCDFDSTLRIGSIGPLTIKHQQVGWGPGAETDRLVF